MVKSKAADLDRVFAALADGTRRSVLEQLDGAGALSVSELAEPHGMSLPGFMKHLAVLEAAGLIARSKEGRIVSCELDALPMQQAAHWIARYERFWNQRLDALGRYLYHQQEVTPCSTSTPNPANTAASGSAAPTRPRRKPSGPRGPNRQR